jgi:hypothetical protein
MIDLVNRWPENSKRSPGSNYLVSAQLVFVAVDER